MEALHEHEANVRQTISTYLEKFGLVQHQIGSYNHFMTKTLPHIIKENLFHEIKLDKPDNKPMYRIRFGKVKLKKPQVRESDGEIHEITPQEARTRCLNYSACVLVDMTQEIYRKTTPPPVFFNIPNVIPVEQKPSEYKLVETREFKEVLLCKIPVMVGSLLCTLNQAHIQKQEYINKAYSKECPYDFGGYFIIKGKEKVIITQETLRTNFPYVTKVRNTSSKFAYQCEVRSGHGVKMRTTSTLYAYMTKPKGGSVPFVYVKIPFLKELVPLLIVYRLLDLHDITSILETLNIGPNDNETEGFNAKLKALILQQNKILQIPLDDIYNWVYKRLSVSSQQEHQNNTEGNVLVDSKPKEKRVQSVHCMVANELLPHMGNGKIAETLEERKINLAKKAAFLSYVIRKTYSMALEGKEDDIDDIGNKRFTAPGVLMALLFRPMYRNMLKVMKMSLEKSLKIDKYTTVTDVINSRMVTHGFRYALSTGNWGILKNSDQQTGVAQVLSRNQVMSTISHATRINHNINRKGRVSKPRQVHPSHWILLDPIETPEGEACGLQKQFAFLSNIRIGLQAEPVIQLLLSDEFSRFVNFVPILKSTLEIRKTMALVFVNMILIGYVPDPCKLALAMQTIRQKQWIPSQASIVLVNTESKREVHIEVDEGCCLRPVFVTEKLLQLSAFFRTLNESKTPVDKWDALLREGFIVYLDKREADTCIVAHEFPSRSPNALYTELHASLLTGVCGSLIPYPQLNQAPRNIYQANMQKQTVSMPTLNFPLRYDSMFHVLEYPQRPLVTTMTSELLGYNEIPAGVNAMVLIGCYTGYNVEDAIILNRRPKDLGMFRSSFYRTYHETEHKYGTHRETITAPDLKKCKNIKDANYDKLQEDGVPRVGQQMNPNDVLIGKVLILNNSKKKGALPNPLGVPTEQTGATGNTKSEEYRDQSVLLRSEEPCQVDQVIFTQNKDSTSSVTVKTRATRIPEVGDKLCLTPDHDVLTEDGWISIAKITKQHKIATLETTSNTIVYERPNHVYSWDHQGPIYDLNTSRVSLAVTLNHRMWCSIGNRDKFELIPASTLQSMTTGVIYFQKNGSTTDILKTEALQKLILAKFAGKQELKLNSIAEGDELQKMCFDAGWSCDLCSLCSDVDSYKNELHAILNTELKQNKSCVSASKAKTVQYKGKVHCVEVSSHVFYVRRNGKVSFTGNSSRHGQKGVLGLLMEPEDMPVAPDGSIPDIIINPHGMPSRMTLAQLTESLMGLLGLLTGKLGDGTAFRPMSIEQIAKAIHEHNQQEKDSHGNPNVTAPPHGNFQFMNGMTGEPLKGKTLYFGPVFYQRLKHMSLEKLHSRSRGPVQILTRQPQEGRSRQGGLRFGEMERDGIVTHGCSSVLLDRLLENSDSFVTIVCKKCGHLGQKAPPRNVQANFLSEGPFCQFCKTGEFCVERVVPWAFKLLVQELEALHVGAHIILKDDKKTA
jgi:DNA-directed RNA polymerase II subunit RPB2